jgi:glycosyltransferase involved in cell wall biosynthesis
MSKLINKKQVLFVGSFKKNAKDGSVGGQMYACQTLIDSELSDQVEWILLDSTADSNIPETITKRTYKAGRRIFLFLYYLVSKKISVVLIFTADGWSFIEKGTMSILAKLFCKKVIIAPRSGLVVNDIEKSSFLRKFIPYVLDNVDFVVCQGDTWKSFYSNLSNSNLDKFIVINNWIDHSVYSASKTNKDCIQILFLAWVDKNKGIYDLINALNYLKNDNYCLNIAGDGQAMSECIILAKTLGITNKINFLSWVVGSDKFDLLAKSDIFVLPSYFEGYPNSLIEAMASSCAVIATNVGSIPDLIINKHNGLIFKPGDILSLAEHLDLLISNHQYRVKIANNGRDSVVLNNSIQTAVVKFKSLIN